MRPKRPLCLVWVLLMIVIWILRAADAPVFGEPKLDPHGIALLNGMPETSDSVTDSVITPQTPNARQFQPAQSAGGERLPEGGAVLQVRGTVTARRETASSMQYMLKQVWISRISETSVDGGSRGSSAAAAGDSDPALSSGDNRPVYFPKILISSTKEQICAIGSVVQCTGPVRRVDAAGNPGQFDARGYDACQGIYYSVRAEQLKVLEEGGGLSEQVSLLRNRLAGNLQRLLPDESAGVLAGMLLGERALLDEEQKRDYQIGGIMHILAISGLHISMLGMGLFLALQYAGLPMMAAAPAASVFMGIYCLLVGNPASAVRAIVMFAVNMGAWMTHRSYDMLSALSLAGILLLLMHPGYLMLPGFQFSFAAVIGTGLSDTVRSSFWSGGAVVEKRSVPVRVRTTCRDACTAYLVISLVTLPLVAWYYYEIPVLGVLSNLLILPFTGIILGFGAAGAAASLISPFLAGVLLYPVHLCLEASAILLRLMRRVPWAMWICGQPARWQIVLYYLLLAAAWMLFMQPFRIAREKPADAHRIHGTAILILAVGVVILLFIRPLPPFTFTALDVGQGDGLVLRAGRNTVYLMDCGSTSVDQVGKYRLIPYLKSQGVRRVQGVFLSHDDQDHISGIEELLETAADDETAVQVNTLFLPCWMEGTETAVRFSELCEGAGASIVYLAQGDTVQDGKLKMQVLHPISVPGGEGTSAHEIDGNEGSMVLRVSYEGFDVLLTGDLEGTGEENLLQSVQEDSLNSGALDGIECLKVAHHGSKNASSEELLSLIHPQIAVISVGKHNRYGHPHPELLARLEQETGQILRTDQNGAVTVWSDGTRYGVRTFL